jgi:hypothetical protein
MNIVEYYEATKLQPFLLVQQANKYKKYNSNFRDFMKKLTKSHPTSLESELKTYMVISSVEITEDLKRQAFDYIEQIGAPKTSVVYNTMVRRLIKKA